MDIFGGTITYHCDAPSDLFSECCGGPASPCAPTSSAIVSFFFFSFAFGMVDPFHFFEGGKKRENSISSDDNVLDDDSHADNNKTKATTASVLPSCTPGYFVG